MKYFVCLLLGILLLNYTYSQTGVTYYVTTKTLNLRSEPNTDSEILAKLSYCDNVNYLDTTMVKGWIKINVDGLEGYVAQKYVSSGKCVKTTYEIRVGAICKDGSRSSATGRGACSHHGGVSYWLTETKESIEIVK